MCWISVQTVDDSVSKTFKIGVSICQSEDFFDQWISSFDWSIGNSSISIDWKRINDFSLPIRECRSQCLKLWNIWNSKSIDDFKKLIFSFFQVYEFCLIESMIDVIKDVGIMKIFVQRYHHGKQLILWEISSEMLIHLRSIIDICGIQQFISVLEKIVFITSLILIWSASDFSGTKSNPYAYSKSVQWKQVKIIVEQINR